MQPKMLAEETHFAPATISQWVTGKRKPDVRDIRQVEASWAPTAIWNAPW